MKVIAFLLVIFNFQLNAHTVAQESITLNEKGASLFKILTEIKKQTGFNFFLAEESMQHAKPVDIDVRNASLKTVLEICFKDQPFTYTISGKNVVITIKKNEPKTSESRDASISIDVKGKVLNPNGEPVAGASISVRDGTKSTTTNDNGEFILVNIEDNAVLIITSVGYEQMIVNVKSQSQLIVTLPIRITSLDEFQVIAYGQTTKRLNTGNVISVKAADIQRQPVSNALLALDGRVPGMEVIQTGGLPGAGIRIKIRGLNSLNSGNAPLFIIDGVPYPSDNVTTPLNYFLGYSYSASGNPLSYINPADIESVDVLKDADATAIYGSRGSNGVVLITTKKAKAGKMQVTINAQTGFGEVPKKLDLLNTREYLDMRYEAFKNDGATLNPNADFDLTVWDTTRYTDWQKELIGRKARYSDIQATVSGGNTNTQVLIGTGYHKETTVFPGDLGNQKASVNFNINNVSTNKKFRVSFSGTYNLNDSRLSSYDLTETALTLPPNAPSMYNSDGSLNWVPNTSGYSTWYFNNPAARLLVGYKEKTNNLIATSTISYQIIPRLDIKSTFGYSNLQSDITQTTPLTYYEPAKRATSQRYSMFSDNNSHTWNIEPQITYSRNIYKGELKVLAGGTIQKTVTDGQTLMALGFNSDLLLEDIKSATTVIPIYSTNPIYRYNAVFGRITYNLQDKYIVNLTARRDGSSRFGPASRFHNFGAVGAAWIFSNENFFKVPIISYGKIRGSYGTSGNDQVGDYSFMDLYNPVSVGVPYMGTSGITPGRIYTPDLAWEETKKTEAGLELGFLKDKVLLSVSGYLNHSDNLLIDYPLPAVAGFTSIRKNLNALVENKGLEIELKTQNISNKYFRWTTSFNLSMNRNRLVSVPSEISSGFENKLGQPWNSLILYDFAGVDPINGLYQVYDLHGGQTTNPDPATDNILVDVNPRFYGGFQNGFAYKSFQLDLHFLFVDGQKERQYLYYYIPGFAGYNQPKYVLNHWQRPGDVSSIQRFSQNNTVLKTFSNAANSDQLFKTISYLRLRNVSLSWQLPAPWKEKIRMQNARLFIQGQNLFTITNYEGLDPETQSHTAVPSLRVVTMGIQVTL